MPSGSLRIQWNPVFTRRNQSSSEPDDEDVHYNLGNARIAQGLTAEATQQFLKASQLDTN